MKFGFLSDQAKIITDVLLCADLFGVESHGISRIMKYYRLLKDGIVDVHAEPEKVHETPLSAVYDARGAMGQL